MWETILVFVVLPAAIYGLLGIATMRSKTGRSQRYRPGQPWEHEPVWWTANPDGLARSGAASDDTDAAAMTLGGARGSW